MKPKVLVSRIKAKENVKSQLLHILEAFQEMDYHKLNDLLGDNAYYEDMMKPSFIYRQMCIFNELKGKGDHLLNLSTNICTGCLSSEPVFVLTGNMSGHKYAIYVQYTQDEITDIFRCWEQSDYFKSFSV
jgi:hypothetical protein